MLDKNGNIPYKQDTMRNADDMTSEELRALAEKRELEEKQNYPKPQKEIDWSPVIRCAKEILEDISEKGYSKDAEHFIYEETMKAIFGSEVFVWLNKHDEGR